MAAKTAASLNSFLWSVVTKYYKLGWLQTTEINSLTVSGARNLKPSVCMAIPSLKPEGRSFLPSSWLLVLGVLGIPWLVATLSPAFACIVTWVFLSSYDHLLTRTPVTVA